MKTVCGKEESTTSSPPFLRRGHFSEAEIGVVAFVERPDCNTRTAQGTMDNYHNLPQKKNDRRALRNNLTPAEATLWKALKNGQIAGRKFRRQHSIGAYVLDFYCPEERLAVELDGAGHFTVSGNLHDATRTAYLESLVIRVLRFENKLIWAGLDNILEKIKSSFSAV